MEPFNSTPLFFLSFWLTCQKVGESLAVTTLGLLCDFILSVSAMKLSQPMFDGYLFRAGLFFWWIASLISMNGPLLSLTR